MKRLRRVIFNMLAAVSALLGGACMGMGIRSYSAPESWISVPRPIAPQVSSGQWQNQSWVNDRKIYSSGGCLQLYSQQITARRSRNPNLAPGYHRLYGAPSPVFRVAMRGRPGERAWSMPGFGYYYAAAQSGYTAPKVMNPTAPPARRVSIGGPTLYPGIQTVVVSWWLLAVPFFILPLLWSVGFWKRLRAGRRFQGEMRCAGCGYDLRATPVRCPECGAMPVGSPSVGARS